MSTRTHQSLIINHCRHLCFFFVWVPTASEKSYKSSRLWRSLRSFRGGKISTADGQHPLPFQTEGLPRHCREDAMARWRSLLPFRICCACAIRHGIAFKSEISLSHWSLFQVRGVNKNMGFMDGILPRPSKTRTWARSAETNLGLFSLAPIGHGDARGFHQWRYSKISKMDGFCEGKSHLEMDDD